MVGDFNSMDKEFKANVQQIGASANPMQHQTEALKARIFHGASIVELGFMGGGKTNSQNPGPEAFGKDERQDMRELAMINDVRTSTHATTAIHGLSGLQQGGYSSEAQEATMYELKKAIDFASDASTGGAVVFHTGEGQRSMYSNLKDKNGDPLFEFHRNEKDEEAHYLVDPDEKKMQAIKEDTKVYVPISKKDTDGEDMVVKDSNGNVIMDELTGSAMPIYDTDHNGDVIVKEKKFADFRKEEEEKLRKEGKDPYSSDNKKNILKSFYKLFAESNVQYQLGYARQHQKEYHDAIDKREKIVKTLKFYEDLKSKIPEEEWKEHFKKYAQPIAEFGLVEDDKQDPIEVLKRTLDRSTNTINYARELMVSGVKQAKQTYDAIDRMQLMEDFAKEEVTSRMAEAAVYAHEKTKQRIAEDKKLYGDNDPNYHSPLEKNPLYVSPEAWQPQDYGSHPDEIREFIKEARQKTYDELKESMHYTDSEARKIADQSIKATVDVGHMNNWRKHFIRKDGESLENYHKRFDKWLLNETEKLAEEGMIGHVHLSDNFGYHDEHLAVGQGNAPIQEFVERMRKHGVEEFINEAGSFNANSAMLDAWTHLGSPIYRVGSGGSGSELDAWGNVHQGYFGHTEPPRYVVGDYSPSDDFKGSPFYSGTPLE
ncbi:hypothetical protein C0585_03440 [Candidatus Woesearchaeota archaeon]|nr:MAG: hypothetical protein C0585_03440 [Candidatus Woesearchaeota archaeon]